MECELEDYGPMGRVPESGAIFMSNRETKKECLKMDLFALPSGFANFVKQVKAGMYLFLFEYEKRQLFGVYQASTDGGINILPKTSSSLLKQYPAQVCFTPVWSCDPLSESEFQDVIRENYFSHKKFNFGLSEDQVHKLLLLFSSRKVKKELQPKQLRDDAEPLPDLRHKLNKKFDAEKLEGRNGTPDLLIRDQGHVADQDDAYRYSVNVTNNRHGTNTFEQCSSPDPFSGSPSTKRRMEDDARNITNLKDHRSVHHNMPALNFGGESRGDTLDIDKRRKEDDDRYLMNKNDPRSIYHSVPDLNFSGEHLRDPLGKVRQSSDSDNPLLSGKLQYEDKDSTLAVGKYIPVSSDLRVAGNDMYTFVDRVVADSENNGHLSSKSPHIYRETFSFGARVLSNDKSFMNLGSKSTSKLCNSHQDASVSEITRDAKCLRPGIPYSLNDTKCSTQGMQKVDLHRPDMYRNSPSVAELRSGDNRPYKNSRFESEYSPGAFLDSGYSAEKFGENTHGGQGVANNELYPVRYEKLKASHSHETIWSRELHRNSGQPYMSSRSSFGDIQFTEQKEVEGEPVMDSVLNSGISFGYAKSCQPKEDPLVYSEGPPPRKQNQLLESQHLVHTYPSYHESMITKSIPYDSDVNFSHPDSLSHRVRSSSSLLRGTPPYYHDSEEPHVGNSSSLLYHPEKNHLRKFSYMDSEIKSDLKYSSASANQDYYLCNTNNCFQNTEVAVNRELGNTMDTNRRSLLLATSPSANTRFPVDVVCREEERVRPHTLSPHNQLSCNYYDSRCPSSSRVFEHNHNKSSGQSPPVNWSTAGLYPGGKDMTTHDAELYASRGQVMGMGKDNAEYPLDVAGIPKSNRRSVFARLSSGPEISSQEELDAERLFSADSIVDEASDMLLQLKNTQLDQGKCQMLAKHDEEEMLKADATVDELMAMLPRGKKSLAKKRTLAGQPDEEGSVEQDPSKRSSAKPENNVIQADGKDPDGPLRETRLVEFKRRSETKKNMDGSIVKAVENRTTAEETTDKACKRRKLVRPVFVENSPVSEVQGIQT